MKVVIEDLEELKYEIKNNWHSIEVDVNTEGGFLYVTVKPKDLAFVPALEPKTFKCAIKSYTSDGKVQVERHFLNSLIRDAYTYAKELVEKIRKLQRNLTILATAPLDLKETFDKINKRLTQLESKIESLSSEEKGDEHD